MKNKVIVEIDGNDGVGKSFLINELKKYNLDVDYLDRGQLTKATDTDIFEKRRLSFVYHY